MVVLLGVFVFNKPSPKVEFIPNSFMEVINKKTYEVGKYNNTKSKFYFTSKCIDKDGISSDTNKSITYRFCNRTSVFFMIRHLMSIASIQ